jgi:hypothetical protein
MKFNTRLAPAGTHQFFLNKKRGLEDPRGAPLKEHVADAIYIEALYKTRPIDTSI